MQMENLAMNFAIVWAMAVKLFQEYEATLDEGERLTVTFDSSGGGYMSTTSAPMFFQFKHVGEMLSYLENAVNNLTHAENEDQEGWSPCGD